MIARELRPRKAETLRFLEAIGTQEDCLHVRPQQSVPLPPADKLIVMREGMLAIDAMPAKGKLQVLDFLVPGDVLSVSSVISTPRVSLRAMTHASLIAMDSPEFYTTITNQDCHHLLIAKCFNQLARMNINHMIIGRLETDQRVASFILMLAMRIAREGNSKRIVDFPMSRVDVANYLVINCDTLSRTMMRFCDHGLIERVSRHAIRILDIDALRELSPISLLMSNIFEGNAYNREVPIVNDDVGNCSLKPIYSVHPKVVPIASRHLLSDVGTKHPAA